MVMGVTGTTYYGYCESKPTDWPAEKISISPEWAISVGSGAVFYSKHANSWAVSYASTGTIPTWNSAGTEQQTTSDGNGFSYVIVGVHYEKHIHCTAPDSDGERTCSATKRGDVDLLCYVYSQGSVHLKSADYPCSSSGGTEKDITSAIKYQGVDKGCCYAPADVPSTHQWLWVGETTAAAARKKLSALVLGIA
jgi:hypothetical protein